MQAKLKDTVALTQELIRSYRQGNPRYVTDICRYDPTIDTDEKPPFPFHVYNEVKADLEHRISGQESGAE